MQPSDAAEPVSQPGPPLTFVAQRTRWLGLVGLLSTAALCVAAAAPLATRDGRVSDYVLMAMTGLLALLNLGMMILPAKVRVADDVFEITCPFRARAPLDNVDELAFHGDSLAITFAELDEVEGIGQERRQSWEGRFHRHGYHVLLPGYTLAQVEQLRAATGAAAPAADSPAAAAEQFYRDLYAATPRVRVSWALIAINIAVFVALALTAGRLESIPNDELLRFGANCGPFTTHGQWWRLGTAVFLHVNLLHLLFNLWVLSSIGPLVERLFGPVGFLLLYLTAGLFGSVASLAFNPQVVSAGASGAIFGLFGALLSLVFVSRSVPALVVRDLRNSGLAFLIFNFVLGFGLEGIDHAAHLGGAVAGFLAGLVLPRMLPDGKLPGWPLRHLLLAGAAVVGLAVAVTALPAASADQFRLREAVRDFPTVERKAVEDFIAAFGPWRKQEITDQEMADVLRDEVLPPWRAIRERLSEAEDEPPELAASLPALRLYLAARQQAWETLEKAARTRDVRLVEQAVQESHQAEDRAAEWKKAVGR